MAEKTIKSRVQNKYANYADWIVVWETFKPLKGEIINFMIPANTEVAGLVTSNKDKVIAKVGNGTDFLKDLPWSSAETVSGPIYTASYLLENYPDVVAEGTLANYGRMLQITFYKDDSINIPSGIYILDKLYDYVDIQSKNAEATKRYSVMHWQPSASGSQNNSFQLDRVAVAKGSTDLQYKLKVGRNFGTFTISDDGSVNWSVDETVLSSQVLKTNNTTEFVPVEDYNPATKKYVDDSVDGFVSYTEQSLTADQQLQAKTNLGIDVLTGNTTAITPTQVKEAILNGRPVSITYTDATWGNLTFTSFGYSLENNVVVANLVTTAGDNWYILGDLNGIVANNQWQLQTTQLITPLEIKEFKTTISNNYVRYSENQSLTDDQKAQARSNIGAISEADLVQPDWNQNDETAKDYIKNRICYKTPDELLGDITFTATSANAMTHTNTEDDMALLAKIQQLTDKGKVIKAIVDGQSCVFDAYFDRGNFFFHGEFTGSVYYNTGRDWNITINNTAVSLTTGQTYTVQFYYIGNIVKIPDEYLSDKVFTHPVSRGDGSNSVIEGSGTKATGNDAHAEGYGTTAQGYYSHAEGYETVASGEYSHAEGKTSQAKGSGSHAEGINYSTASGVGSHAEGYSTKAVGDYSHAEGYSTEASKVHSHAEGRETLANGEDSHAEGRNSVAVGNRSHAEGSMTRSNGDASHAEGVTTYANGTASHAEGNGCYASSNYSHAEGNNTIAYGESSHSQGKYNIKDDSGLLAHIVGNGKDLSSRSNAHTLDWSGNAWYAGDVYVGSTSGTNKDEGSKKLATEEYVNNHSTTITIDTELSTTSTNAIQNKAVKTAIDSLQTAIDGKIDTTALNYGLTQVTNDVAANYIKFTAEQTLTDEQKAQARENINAPSPADAVYTATASSTDGVAYTATVPGIDSLTVGASFIMIPDKVSTSKAPTLNVNGLGAKPIRRRLSSLATGLQQGYSASWISNNKPFTVVYDGTAWIIEGMTRTDGADVYGAVAQATADANGNNIVDTYATIAMLQSLLPKVTTITLTTNWTGSASPYYQDIALSCVTETSIVDLQPTPEQLNSWQDEGIAFTTLSGNGTVRVYVAGGKPSSTITVQVRVQEVTVI